MSRPDRVADTFAGLEIMSRNDLYQPLLSDEYRLLKIVHDNEKSIKCRIQSYHLDDPPGYSAVSYTWGAAEDPAYSVQSNDRASDPVYAIKVNDYHMEITENLFDMLYQFRTSHDASVNYWIDAICINQEDIEEKIKQVNQMAQIYSGAVSVVVWLGKSNGGTPEVIKLMQQLSAAFRKEYEANRPAGRFAGLTDPLNIEQMKQLGIDDVTTTKWLNLASFYQRRWFYRVWTIQEAALAKDIIAICGNHELAWNRIIDAARLLCDTPLWDALRELVWNHLRMRISMRAPFFEYCIFLARGIGYDPGFDNDPSLWGTGSSIYSNNVAVLDRLLFGVQDSSATDPRDHIFGILGLVSRVAREYTKEPFPFLADYTKETSELYTEIMGYMIRETGMLTLLGRVRPPTYTRTPGLPSWVVDFSATGPAGIFQVSNYTGRSTAEIDARRTGRVFNASGASTVGFRIENARLNCHTFMCSRVIMVGESGEDLVASSGFEQTAAIVIASLTYRNAVAAQIELLYKSMICDMNRLYGLEASDGQLRVSFSSFMLSVSLSKIIYGLRRGEKRSEIIATMTSQERLSKLDEAGIIPSSQAVEDACELIGLLENGIGSINFEEKDRLVRDYQLYRSFLVTYMNCRRTFLADDGSIGLGSTDIQPGDEVHIIADGARTPFILRQSNSGQESDRVLIGEAFVHGLMYGEAVETMHEAGRNWEQLAIV